MRQATFPFKAAVAPAAARGIEPAALQLIADGLAAGVGALLDAACRGAVDAAPAAMSGEALSFARGDGLTMTIDLPRALCELVAVRRCGGPLSMADLTGATGSASVGRAVDRLTAAAMAAIDRACRGGTGWLPADAGSTGETVTLRLDFDMLGFEVGLRLCAGAAAAPAQAIAEDHPHWPRDLQRLVGATGLPVRVVLHEKRVALADAARLRPGDVLPIETPRSVQLRIGTHSLGRGTVDPADENGVLLVTIGGAAHPASPQATGAAA